MGRPTIPMVGRPSTTEVTTVTRRRSIAPLLLLLAAVLASCSAGARGSGASATMPDCAPRGAPISRPELLPVAFPLPPGTVLTQVHESSAGATVIAGVIPLPLADAAGYFLDEMPRAGFDLGPGDAEQDEAESAFTGAGIDGQFKVHSILDCGDAVTLTLALIRR